MHPVSRIFAGLFWVAPIHAALAARDAALNFFEDRVQRDAEDFIAWNQLAARYHQQLRRTGELRFLELEKKAAEASLKALPAELNPGGLAAFAQVQLAMHRFKEAAAAAQQLQTLQPGKARPLELLADAQIELGDYPAAEKTCQALAEADSTGLSAPPRQARLALVHGQPERAEAFLEEALAQAGERSDVAGWLHQQLGHLAFKLGDWERAEQQYAAAEKAEPESYAVQDYLGELRAAQGRYPEAIAIYEKLVEKLARPEFLQALGDILVLHAQPEKAAESHQRAASLFLESTGRGETLYFHHLAGFYADSQENPEKAVHWARRDLELRQSIYAHDALAWALYKNGAVAEAASEITKALATGTQDPHVLYHAGMIRMGFGDLAGGREALQQAARVNPRFNTFHVHR